MDRADYVLRHSASGTESNAWPSDLLPSEVLRRNFWFCSIDDPSAVAQRHVIGLDHIMVESDYPHADSSWPDTQAVLARDLGRAARRRAAGGGRRQRQPAVPPPAPAGRRLAHADHVSGRGRSSAPTPRRPDRRRRRPRGRARVGLGRPARPVPAPHQRRPCRLRARRGRRHRAAGGAAGQPRPSGLDLRRPGVVPPAGGRPAGRVGPGGPAARHGQRGHRPGRAVPDHRAVLLAAGGPGGGGGPGRAPTTTGSPATAPPTRAGCSGRPCSRCRTRRPRRASSAAASSELGLVAGFVRPNPCLGPLALRPRLRRGVGGGRGARRAHRHPRGQFGGSCRPSGRTAPSTRSSSMRCPTPSRPCSPAPSSSPSGRSSAIPGLRLLFLESSGGWAPFWLERLDEQAESFGGFCPDMALRPSEYFARQCAISFEVDEHTLPALVPFVGREPHRLGQRLPAPRRHVPRRRRGHPGHRGPLPHRDPGARAGAQRPPAATGSRRDTTGCPGCSTTTSRR